MGSEWIKTDVGKQVVGHLFDNRPVWLYSLAGAELVWCNPAAHLLNAKQKNNNPVLAPLTTSLKTQVEHILKLTPIGRSSLARVRFGSKSDQIFVTCSCTPIKFGKDEKSILIIGVDKIKKPIMEKYSNSPKIMNNLFEPNAGFVVLDDEKQAIMGSDDELLNFKKDGFNSFKQNFGEVIEFPIAKTSSTIFLLLEKKSKSENFPIAEKSRNLSSLVEGEIKGKIVKTQKLEIEQEKIITEVKLYKVIGKGFEEAKTISHSGKISKQAANGQRSANYNFEELSRILLKKTSREVEVQEGELVDAKENLHNEKSEKSLEKTDNDLPTSLVHLPQETLILNRLPLGLLIFRDQEIVFANREMLKITGYDDLTDLRNSGLASLFPASKPSESDQAIGPITHLQMKEKAQIAVNARLQVITWQGKSSFLLSAYKKEEKPPQANISDVDAVKYGVREFASNLAQIEKSGFFITDRSGIINKINAASASMLNKGIRDLVDVPISEVIKSDNLVDLRFFLEQDAKSAHKNQPFVLLKTLDPNIEILLFTEGRAGVISSYFGIIREVKISPILHKKHFSGIEPEILENLSRSMRRPLNTIIGFSELISSHTFGSSGNARYDEYTRDIKTAAGELVGVVDDLETIIKLKDTKNLPANIDFDLVELLEKCLFRTRSFANKKQVLIRSAISSHLGRIKADEASLEQAILNLIASAIEQTPRGELVVISAQQQQNGAVVINIRDSGMNNKEDLTNFVVFRDEKSPDGVVNSPIVSSVGLSLTRSLLAVNTCSLDIEPNVNEGTTFSLSIPASLLSKPA